MKKNLFESDHRERVRWGNFFDLRRRYEGLDAKNDPLVAIAAMVPWECLRPKLRAALITGELRTSEAARKSPAGRKPWDEVVIFKALAGIAPLYLIRA